ncbi:hypothetical protein, partial [uncultured Bacteroides sp.]|uniref:hypothetical protein n=1 Tax=uncultured Bacteroides sp. TaxID=162156 RepID=UPI00258842FB
GVDKRKDNRTINYRKRLCQRFDTTSSFPVMESNFLHGGKNKCLLRFSLTVAEKRDKSGDAAA